MEESPFEEDIVSKADGDTFTNILEYPVRYQVINVVNRRELSKANRLAKLATTDTCQVPVVHVGVQLRFGQISL